MNPAARLASLTGTLLRKSDDVVDRVGFQRQHCEPVETYGAPGARRQTMLHCAQQTVGKRQSATTVGCARRIDSLKTSTEFGRIIEFMKTVCQFDALIVKFESFGNFEPGIR